MVNRDYFAERFNNVVKASHAASNAASLVVDLEVSASQIFKVLDEEITQQEKEVEKLRSDVAEKDNTIAELKKQLEEKENALVELQKKFEPIDTTTVEN